MTICFGLHGGIGNAIFCLPAIKTLARTQAVELYVEGDYPLFELFRHCNYAFRVHHLLVPPAHTYLCGQYAPKRSRAGWHRCAWADGEKDYPHPEWMQIKRLACGGEQAREDVSDWFVSRDTPPKPAWDFGIVPGCKPGEEWRRKKIDMQGVVHALTRNGHSARAFGRGEEIAEAGLREIWIGEQSLGDLPQELRRCRVIVGTDSGVTHLASSLGIPTVMVFTATSPVKGDPVGGPRINRKIWRGIECSPCQSTPRWRACTDWRCREVLVDEVAWAAMALLEPRTCGFSVL